MKNKFCFFLSVLSFTILFEGGAAGQDMAASVYSIKPSDVEVPEGLQLGQYRRIIQPFKNWTLVCDEDLKKKKRICNISQIIVDRAAIMIFSWSLAATEAGKPVMILRVPPSVGKDKALIIQFPDREAPISVRTTACSSLVCIAMLPIERLMREQIGKQNTLQISYTTGGQETVVVHAPLMGLPTALSTIK
ncbi:MAG: hypothetical protein JWP25_1148 [Bradyrhizobium sp.]|nr:hypothetical protein [Bradyrhizobium sp.]